MITARGVYSISLDGGKTFSSKNNMLLSNYYRYSTKGSFFAVVGSNTTPVTFNDTAIPSGAQSPATPSFDEVVDIDNVGEDFISNKSFTFEFGTGLNLTIQEVGIVSNGRLVSRAVYSEPVYVTELDSLVVRYTIQYIVNTKEHTFNFDYKGRSIIASVRAVNPNQWGKRLFGYPLEITAIALGGGWTVDQNNYIVGGNEVFNKSIATIYEYSDTKRVAKAVLSAGLNEAIGSYNQALIKSGSNGVLLITFNQQLDKTSDDFFGFSLGFEQEHYNDT